jgi:uncharacterized damage-inducible protein DinB
VSVSVPLDSLLAYSDYERRKWREWISADPKRLRLPFQPGGRFPDIGSLLDHLFLVERRHLSRLEGGTPPPETGVPPGDVKALFDYADLVRADLRAYVASLDEAAADRPIVITGLQSSGDVTMTRRRLIVHIVLHEIRHLAQIAYAARLTDLEPPGRHDIFYFDELTGF